MAGEIVFPQKNSAPELVVKYFISKIKAGELQAGEKLPSERDLMAVLHISRFTLREGLARLSALGILDIKHGKGAFIRHETSGLSLSHVFTPWLTHPDAHTYDEIYEARALIERELVRKLALQPPQEAAIALQASLVRQELQLPHPEGFATEDLEFHRILARFSTNRFFRGMHDVLTEPTQPLLQFFARRIENRQQAYLAHQTLVQAILNHDPNLADQLLVQHLADSRVVQESLVLETKEKTE